MKGVEENIDIRRTEVTTGERRDKKSEGRQQNTIVRQWMQH